MVMRWFLIYVVVELAAVVALASTIGIGWTALLLLATFAIGLVLAGSQVKRHIRRLRNGFDNPQGALTDSALIGLGTLLVVIPGLVTSALGLLLLSPPTRAAACPVLSLLVARRVPLIGAAAAGSRRYDTARHGDYIDGEVIDVVDVEPPALPPAPS
ncbi:MAG: protein FxsA [Mycobacterium sp.]|jgi:UPF0716 protein FxsA|nr:protein FxsA [Mycobacterium sp.]